MFQSCKMSQLIVNYASDNGGFRWNVNFFLFKFMVYEKVLLSVLIFNFGGFTCLPALFEWVIGFGVLDY